MKLSKKFQELIDAVEAAETKEEREEAKETLCEFVGNGSDGLGYDYAQEYAYEHLFDMSERDAIKQSVQVFREIDRLIGKYGHQF